MPARDVQREADVTSKSDISGSCLTFFKRKFAAFVSKHGFLL